MNSYEKDRQYRVVFSNPYKRDLKIMRKRGYDLSKLEDVVLRLAKGERLPDKHRDHELKGVLKGIRECHIEPDWILAYSIDEGKLSLLLIRTGTHRDVLGIE